MCSGTKSVFRIDNHPSDRYHGYLTGGNKTIFSYIHIHTHIDPIFCLVQMCVCVCVSVFVSYFGLVQIVYVYVCVCVWAYIHMHVMYVYNVPTETHFYRILAVELFWVYSLGRSMLLIQSIWSVLPGSINLEVTWIVHLRK